MSLQDELRAAAQESEEYSLLTRAADALDKAERSHIEAWETDDAVAVVWGTHNPAIAEDVYREFYEQNAYDPGQHPVLAQWRDNAVRKWARPDLRFMEETWPENAFGNDPVGDWVPYLVLAQ